MRSSTAAKIVVPPSENPPEKEAREGRISFRAEQSLIDAGNKYAKEQGEVSLAAVARKAFIQFLVHEGYMKEKKAPYTPRK